MPNSVLFNILLLFLHAVGAHAAGCGVGGCPSPTASRAPPACTPTFVLDGATEGGFNEANTPFAIKPSCGRLNTESTAVFLRSGPDGGPFPGLGAKLEDLAIAPDAITVHGLDAGHKTIAIMATDDQGNKLLGSFVLVFGSISVPVVVEDDDGKPVSGASVTAVAYRSIRQHGVTDSSGTVNITNLPVTPLDLSAKTADGRLGFAAIATPGAVTVKLLSPSGPDSRNTVSGIVDDGDRSKSVARRSQYDSRPPCQKPFPKSCDFYTQCAESSLKCGPGGYPLRYGAKNCDRFVERLDNFSTQGRDWIWRVMTCLQEALVGPIEASSASCESVQDAAFASHPRCYVDSGFCNLSVKDLIQVVMTVKTDLFHGPAMDQVLTTAKECSSRFLSALRQKIAELNKSPTQADPRTADVLEDFLERYLEKYGNPAR